MQNIPEYIDYLLTPSCYPHAADDTHLVQTHISFVILAGDYVYKWKKPVNFGFVDFSTLARRKHFCEEELRLNRRLCPEIYLGLTWVSREGGTFRLQGDGEIVEYYKNIEDILEEDYLEVPHYSSVEEVARKIHGRQRISIYDDICITRSGKYFGTVSVSAILNAVTENSMMLARGANPLTGLPGNEYIQRRIAKMLSQSLHFDVCYIDLDSFKPFNDRHGFEMGDRVIKTVGELMVEALNKWGENSIGFAGHIGGDDFILITRPRNSIPICQHIIDEFARILPRFHTEEECRQGSYTSRDRAGQLQQFGLLSLSIGIVSTEIHHIGSFAEVSSIASDLKKRAKETSGSIIVRDRRSPVAQQQGQTPMRL